MNLYWKCLAIAGILTTSSGLFAAPNNDNKKEEEYASHCTLFHDSVGKGKVKQERHSRHGSLGYAQTGFMISHSESSEEKKGLDYAIGYKHDAFHWGHKKKRFHERNFNNVLLSFGGHTSEVENWKVEANVGLDINTRHFALSRYTLFKGFLQGKYTWKPDTNLYIGVLGITGMRATSVLPIIGFDYKASDKWNFNFIIPYNISAVYTINERWSCDAAFRTFYSHQRLGTHERSHRLRRGIITYRNTGVELGLKYKDDDRINASIHIGETLGGRLRTENHSGKQRKHFKVGSAAYIGARLTIGF